MARHKNRRLDRFENTNVHLTRNSRLHRLHKEMLITHLQNKHERCASVKSQRETQVRLNRAHNAHLQKLISDAATRHRQATKPMREEEYDA